MIKREDITDRELLEIEYNRKRKAKEKILKEQKKEKRTIETSKKVLFALIALLFFVFSSCIYLFLSIKDTVLAATTLKYVVIICTPVVTAIIIKSGFENNSKGKARKEIIDYKIRNNEVLDLGDEDFSRPI